MDDLRYFKTSNSPMSSVNYSAVALKIITAKTGDLVVAKKYTKYRKEINLPSRNEL